MDCLAEFTDNPIEREYWMEIAINIAYTNIGRTGKKPCVGAIIVKDGIMLSSGVTSATGQHAEQIAIDNAITRDINIAGSTIFTTLEPCSHYGETPPCVKAIVAAEIQNAVVGVIDPDERVSGTGIEYLKANGVNVIVMDYGPVYTLYQSYFTFKREKRPYIVLKIAQSLDGKIAKSDGTSKWITSEGARRYTNFLRSRFNGILIGANALRLDNPKLDCRIPGLEKFSPRRFVASSQRHEGFFNVDGTVEDIISRIYGLGIQHLLVEGGANLITQFIKSGIFDEIILIQAPIVIGSDGLSSVQDLGLDLLPKQQMRVIERLFIEDNIINRLQNKKTAIANE